MVENYWRLNESFSRGQIEKKKRTRGDFDVETLSSLRCRISCRLDDDFLSFLRHAQDSCPAEILNFFQAPFTSSSPDYHGRGAKADCKSYIGSLRLSSERENN